jgi:hypothetical protein
MFRGEDSTTGDTVRIVQNWDAPFGEREE